MNKLKIVWLLAMVLCLGACSKHDKEYSDVTPPVVEGAEYAITGNVTDYQGNVIANAVITTPEGLSVKTDNGGVYFMSVPEPESSKTYTLTASYEGKKDLSKTVTIIKQKGGMIKNQNFRFHTTTVTTLTNGDGDQNTEYIDENENAECLVGAHIEGYEGDDLQLETFYYTEDFGAEEETHDPTSGTFEKEKMFFASSVSSVDGKKDKAGIPYTLFFNFNTETQNHTTIKCFNNGQWSNVPESQMIHESNQLTITGAITGAIYAAFCIPTITLTQRNTPLSFDPSDVDNTYGSEAITVPFTEFGYKTGVDLYLPTQYQLQALLMELIARDFGLVSHNKTYTWNVNLTLPVGTGVSFSGNQEYTHIAYKKFSRTAEANLWGDAKYSATTYNHQHVGGGN